MGGCWWIVRIRLTFERREEEEEEEVVCMRVGHEGKEESEKREKKGEDAVWFECGTKLTFLVLCFCIGRLGWVGGWVGGFLPRTPPPHHQDKTPSLPTLSTT